MNHFVPDFEMEEDDSISTSSGLSRPNDKPFLPEDELMELLWQNGQVVLQSQNQRSMKKSPAHKFPGESTAKDVPSSAITTDETQYQLFMQEDEMSSWLHYPLDEDSFQRDFSADLLYPSPSGNYTHSSRVTQIPDNRRLQVVDHLHIPPPVDPRPPIPPVKRTELESPFHHNFKRFSSRPNVRTEISPAISDKALRESTVVDSSETPPALLRLGPIAELRTCDLTMTSSSGGSAEPLPKSLTNNDRKRKVREDEEEHDDDEDAKLEAGDTKKQVRGSVSVRRSRAAEVHNLSERRRRDRINEKMKALQELIPRCNKSDKASMLDEAIEYLKSLQLQVQMMSMGCSMVPMVFPGVQQYMPPMGMGMGVGMGMGMGMGMDIGLSRPMMPFPQVLAGSSIPRPATAAHLSTRLPMPAFHLPSGSSPDVSTIRHSQSDPSLQNIGIQSPNPLQVPNFADSYQHYLSLYNMHAPPRPPQNNAVSQPSTSKGVQSLDNQKRG